MLDWAQVAADIATLIADNAQVIRIRRGTVTLPAQTVRIARAGQAGGRIITGEAAAEARGRVVVVGGLDFDGGPVQ